MATSPAESSQGEEKNEEDSLEHTYSHSLEPRRWQLEKYSVLRQCKLSALIGGVCSVGGWVAEGKEWRIPPAPLIFMRTMCESGVSNG